MRLLNVTVASTLLLLAVSHHEYNIFVGFFYAKFLVRCQISFRKSVTYSKRKSIRPTMKGCLPYVEE